MRSLNKYFVSITFALFTSSILFANDGARLSASLEKCFYDTVKLSKNDSLFNGLNLGKLGLGRIAFDYAMLGYNVLKAKGKLANDRILSIADMSTPSGKKRFFCDRCKES